LDSQSQLEDFYMGQAAAGLDYGPEDLALLLRMSQGTGGRVGAAGTVSTPSIFSKD
jgi:hypothetical protein